MNNSAGNRSGSRLLVLAPNWLGDVIMHTPLLSLLHEHRADLESVAGGPFEFHLGVRGAWADLFSGDPRVDEVVRVDGSRRHRGLAGTFRLATVMRRGRYDAVILVPPSLRAGLAAWLARIPGRVGYRSDGRSIFLTEGLAPVPRGDLHYSREVMDLGRAWFESLGLGRPATGSREFPPSLPGCEGISPADLGTGPAIWAVAPGATYGEAKAWPLKRLGDFVNQAINEAGVRVILLGDDAAHGSALRLRERLGSHWSKETSRGPALLDLTGQTDLAGAIEILKASSAFIGNDSGLMHLAAALGLPTVGVFGSSNPAWTAPLGKYTRAVFPDGFSCRPCYRKTCNQPEFCLDTVAGESVMAAVLELVAEDRAAKEGT